MTHTLTTSRQCAPEDLKAGDYISIARVTCELLPACFDEPFTPQRDLEPLRFSFMPDNAGKPLKIKQLCLPFVLVKQANGRHETLDLRRHHVLKLDTAYGKKAFKRLRKDRKEKNKS